MEMKNIKMNKNLVLGVEIGIKCSNPRCITTTEHYLPKKFYKIKESKTEYRCEYCDHTALSEGI